MLPGNFVKCLNYRGPNRFRLFFAGGLPLSYKHITYVSCKACPTANLPSGMFMAIPCTTPPFLWVEHGASSQHG